MLKNKKTILVITDGIGHNASSFYNAFAQAKKPTYDKLFSTLPNSMLKTSGLSVGLPDGQMGNSEVGHMCIGSGRILYQNLVKINKAIENNTLQKNESLKGLFENTKNIHIIGLFSDGGVHSHINHILTLAKIAKKEGKKVFIHALTDGRDVSPTATPRYLKQLDEILDEDIILATIGGRFYAMDRDKRWERIEKGYKTIVEAENKIQQNHHEYIQNMYDKDITDEFIIPAAFNDFDGISPNDGIILANFRNDRMRQLASALGIKEFSEFDTKNTFDLITLTEYDANFDFPIMYPSEKLKNTLADVISSHNLTQFHTAETEKYAHVTFFFNGGVEQLVENETRVLIPSPKVATYDLRPQMSAKEVGEAVLKAMENKYDFIVVNFANGDMVGHTGNLKASIKAVESVDTQLGKIIEKSDEKDYNVLITSDHGNCEELQDKDGNPLTNHTTYDVYCFLKAKGIDKVSNGGLSNIAPTILKLMDLPIPKEMDKPLI